MAVDLSQALQLLGIAHVNINTLQQNILVLNKTIEGLRAEVEKLKPKPEKPKKDK